jgi:hypothetical protein
MVQPGLGTSTLTHSSTTPSSSSQPSSPFAANTPQTAGTVPGSVGGRLSLFAPRWEAELGSAAMIRTGWEPEWPTAPPPRRHLSPPTPQLPLHKHAQMAQAIREELETHVIRRIRREDVVWEHPTYLIPKKKLRKIMNAAASRPQLRLWLQRASSAAWRPCRPYSAVSASASARVEYSVAAFPPLLRFSLSFSFSAL